MSIPELIRFCPSCGREGVTYPTEDLYFVCTVQSLKPLTAQDEVESLCFLAPDQIDMEKIAFPTARQALQLYFRQGEYHA